MFTGIVEQKGHVARLARRGGGARLEIRAPEIAAGLQLGDSVAVNGACVTVTELSTQSFACDLVPETVARTTLGILAIEEEVNLERPMRASDRFGGHIVQGHVDSVGVVRSRRRVGAQEILEITIPFELTRYLAPQGSVALDGVSLTVVAVDKERFRVALIPYTVEMTTLGQKVQGASCNVEIDILSKYVERHMIARMARPSYLVTEREALERVPDKTPRPAAPVKRVAARSAPRRSSPKRPAAAKGARKTKTPARASAKASRTRAAKVKTKAKAKRTASTKRKR